MMNEIQDTTHDTPTRSIRKDFFAFRNGIVADKLRSAGDPHTIIMGSLLVDIAGIASRARKAIGKDDLLAATAQQLWDDVNSRECRLAAPMLFPPELMSRQLAMTWCQGIESTEVADNLCHKLLRHIPESTEVMNDLVNQQNTMTKYTGYRLMQGLLRCGKLVPTPSLKADLEAERATAQPPISSLIRDIIEDLEDED